MRPTPKAVADARSVLRAERDARKADRGTRVIQASAKPAPTDDGSDYMAWLHSDISCVACLVLGRHPTAASVKEAAHQKLQLHDRGFHRRAGRRGPHWTCVCLCAGHHRIGPICCDPAQSKFWGLVGFEPEQVADFIEAMNAAYRDGEPGEAVVRRFAAMARKVTA